jgi:tetratricopeptide (TPR) repeat protein
MATLPRLGVLLGLSACLVGAGSSARTSSVVDLLDRYAGGKFDAVAAELANTTDFEELLNALRRDAPAWLDANGPADRARRELAAATFALEAARIDSWHEWKWVIRQPLMGPPPGVGSNAGGYQPLSVLYWKPPPLLIEWGCQLLSQPETPRPFERWWQLAALSVAQRSEDPAFLVGDPAIGRGAGTEEVGNLQDEIKHLDHVQKRFPDEPRFMLGQGIARDRMWKDDAAKAYLSVIGDPDVGGEAAMRLGAMRMRGTGAEGALANFDRALTLTRDRYVVYLAHYFKGQIYEAQDQPQKAQAELRRAVAAWPHGQAATMALAMNLFDHGKRTEAHGLAGAMLAAPGPPTDPWRAYVHADDRFWPFLVARLRAEIAK